MQEYQIKKNQNKSPCLNAPRCAEWTGHGSGLCEPCRTKTCSECGARFTAKLHRANLKRAMCGNCERNYKERMRRNG